MKNFYFKKIITVISCAVFSALFIVTLFFCAPKIDAVPDAKGRKITEVIRTDDKWENVEFETGKDFAAVSITDLADTGRLTKVNYIADKFVQAGHITSDMQTVDLTKPFEFAQKGTLMFVILNLDPWSEDFDEQSEALSKYRQGENWCFTVKLPQIFSASNVYSNAALIARNGEIEDYDFSEFNTNYVNKTENFSIQTEPTYIELRFYTERKAISNGFITIHYQSTGSAYSGIADCPIIGTESAVKSVGESSKNLLLTFAILAAVVLAVLIVLSALERSKAFVPAIVWLFGIFMLLLCRFLLSGVTGAPLLLSALSLAMSFIILGGAQLALGYNVGKIPLKYIFPAVSAVGALFAFLCPFLPFGAAGAMRIVCAVIKGVGAASLCAFIALALIRKKDEHGILQTSCAAVIAVAVIASLFMPQIFPAQMNSLFWLCVATAVATFVSVIMAIAEMKKFNVYLTANLHMEVERQVKDIKAVIADRDNLLQFVSHDMKKPLSSAVMLCDTAIEREKDAEQIKMIRIIKQDTERVITHLSEIAAYAKFNYLAEPSQVVDMSELCALLYKYHQFDCDANGIVLNNTVGTPVKAFMKPKGIENVVSNIIINAIEHANCSTVTLSVKTDKNKVILCIADDGKGIDNTLDVFKPYVSENNTETGGVGLYICKNIIESMNGELTFDSSPGGTVFYISLLKA